MAGVVRVGIGGWNFEPWDSSFYPEKLAKARQLDFASRQLAVIEVNSTYYSSQKPATFAKWASSVPDGFVFSLKASRFCTNRKKLADSAESVGKFLKQGIVELGDRLGPILWQFMPTKKFEAEDFEAFLQLLPEKQDGLPLRHAVEVRHISFLTPTFVALARQYGVAIVLADHADYPLIADVTGDFVYLRLQKGEDHNPKCYPEPELPVWGKRIAALASGGTAPGLPHLDDERAPDVPRDAYVFFITGGKVNAPAGAMALQAMLSP
ncbi:DUF72 domain-containing protein [Martelella sp. HB161492]|uniref:DUF72 domain-containing protein n=1 Tax=Martelella sp. HB161492 TaxID=2720726 RepID=UPI00159283F9|nr:DUF72 domain-containing protein [Martelella sp. HB161492]